MRRLFDRWFGLRPFGLFLEDNITVYWDNLNHQLEDGYHTWCGRCGAQWPNSLEISRSSRPRQAFRRRPGEAPGRQRSRRVHAVDDHRGVRHALVDDAPMLEHLGGHEVVVLALGAL
jgi:hypothetical protein